ncbi:MAG: peptidoglycan-binding protein [Actinomycetota bacterium]|nr:peptidoglycan-binding protein [Actinomycetota bacterium]
MTIHFRPHFDKRAALRIVSLGLTLGVPLAFVTATPLLAAESIATGLSQGATGDAVAALQRALIANNVEVVGGADGVFGAKTLEALNSFQRSHGLAITQTVDEATAVALGIVTAPTNGLARGASGDAVAQLQQALVDAGHNPAGGVDGVFGPGTEAALRAFQTASGLEVTGTVDQMTAARLMSRTAIEPAAAELVVAAPVAVSAALAETVGLRYGDWGDRVTAVQEALIAAGVSLRGGADGLFGRATESALRDFQSSVGIDASGVVDEATINALSAGAADEAPSAAAVPAAYAQLVGLRPGALGDSVAALQRRLLDLGVRVRGGADGVFGPATSQSVKEFQSARGIEATGVVDEATAVALGADASTASSEGAVETTTGYGVYGESGERVRVLQQAIVDAGITLRGGVDGVFGSATAAAVMSVQRAHGIQVTGVVNTATAEVLGLTGTAAPVDSPVATISLAVFPVQGACGFTDTWHDARSGGRLHLGVDIIASTGKLIYAVADGTITKIYNDGPGSLAGNGLRLTMVDGTYFFYAHLDTFAEGIAEGVEVTAGQVLGTNGATGNAGTAHLHFEVHPGGGAAVNPYPIVKAVDACDLTEPLVMSETSDEIAQEPSEGVESGAEGATATPEGEQPAAPEGDEVVSDTVDDFVPEDSATDDVPTGEESDEA